jgi:hypothetical protein
MGFLHSGVSTKPVADLHDTHQALDNNPTEESSEVKGS